MVDVGARRALDTRALSGLLCPRPPMPADPVIQNPLLYRLCITVCISQPADLIGQFALCYKDTEFLRSPIGATPSCVSPLYLCIFVYSTEKEEQLQQLADGGADTKPIQKRPVCISYNPDRNGSSSNINALAFVSVGSATNGWRRIASKQAPNRRTGAPSFGQLAPRAAAAIGPDWHRDRRLGRVSQASGPVSWFRGSGRGLGAIIPVNARCYASNINELLDYQLAARWQTPDLVARDGSGVSRVGRENVFLRRTGADRGPSLQRNDSPQCGWRLPAIVVGLYTLRNAVFRPVRGLKTHQLTKMGRGAGPGGAHGE